MFFVIARIYLCQGESDTFLAVISVQDSGPPLIEQFESKRTPQDCLDSLEFCLESLIPDEGDFFSSELLHIVHRVLIIWDIMSELVPAAKE